MFIHKRLPSGEEFRSRRTGKRYCLECIDGSIIITVCGEINLFIASNCRSHALSLIELADAA